MSVKVEFAGEKMEFRSALFAGRLDDLVGSPTSCYVGSIDPDEIHTALYYMNRAVIKLLTGQFDVPFSDVDSFLLSAMSEALVKEHNIKATGRDDLEERTTVKFKKNQN